jgi:hypothetical protein
VGKYDEKIKEHFWMLVLASMKGKEEHSAGTIRNASEFKETVNESFKIQGKEAIKLVDDHLWEVIYSMIRETPTPEELRVKLDPIIQIDGRKIKDDIWKIVLFSVSKKRDIEFFKQTFLPGFKIKANQAIKLVDDQLWTILYSRVSKAKTPEEIRTALTPIVKINVKNAAKMIKKRRPEKFELLQVYK